MSEPLCFHCSEIIPSNLNIISTIDDQQVKFCCYGCQAVAEFIRTEDLTNYYKHRTAAAPNANQLEEIADHSLELVRDPEIYPLYVHVEDGVHQIQLSIQGMTCAACAWLIEKIICKLPGIVSLHINLSSSIATLQWRPELINLHSIGKEVNRLGYHVTPYRLDKEDSRRIEERKKAIIRLGVAGVGMMQVMMSAIAMYAGDIQGMEESYRNLLRWSSFFFATPVIFYSAAPFFKAALRDIKVRYVTMDLPVAIGIGLAYVSSVYALLTGGGHVYFDAVTMFTFFLLMGRFFEEVARHRSQLGNRKDAELVSVNRITEQGIEIYPKSKLTLSDKLLIAAGESFPTDGVILQGETNIDESSLTGEYLPVFRKTGDTVVAGTTNIDQPIHIEVTAIGAQTRAAAIERLTDRALSEKPRLAILADKVAHYFVLAVLVVATLTYIGWYFIDPDQAYWIMVSVLVVTCPCALSLATPVALTNATNKMKTLGLVVTRGHVIESLANCSHIIFDKTGTLTHGKFDIVSVNAEDPTAVLNLCAALETNSIHPIAKAFNGHFKFAANNVTNVVGLGVEGEIDGTMYRLGNAKFMSEWQVSIPSSTNDHALTLYLATQQQLIASIILKDKLRKDSNQTIASFRKYGIRVSLLTGDTYSSAKDVLSEDQFDDYITDQSPEQKWQWLSQQIDVKNILMVGDGLNDVPTLAGANTSIAMGQSSDLAKIHADAILLNNQINTIGVAIRLAKQCRRVIKQNLFWAATYNGIMLPAAVVGLVPPWAAAIGMAASSLVVVLNATRLSK